MYGSSHVSFYLLMMAMRNVVSCPDGCLCQTEQQALCNDAGLTEIPGNLPSSLTYLSVAGNNIKKIPVNLTSMYPNLNKLYLDRNQIQNIEPYTFQGLSGMAILSLTGNPFETLPKLAFPKLKNITTLTLSNNNISKIESLVFAGADNFQMLLLAGNPLVSIESSAFTGLSNVGFLQLPEGIQNIDADAFNGLTMVGYLKLSKMKAKFLPKGLFNGIDNVTVLTIQDSELGKVHPYIFEGAGNVETLEILGNTIDQFSLFKFDEHTSIGKFIFHNNIVNRVSYPVHWGEPSMQSVSLINNTFPCDCSLHWLKQSGVEEYDKDFFDKNYCGPGEISLSSALAQNISECQVSDYKDDFSSGATLYFQPSILNAIIFLITVNEIMG